MKKDTDYVDKMVEYLRKNIKKGYTKEALKWALVNQGYSRMEIDKAIKNTERDMASRAPMLSSRPQIRREIVNDNFEEKKGFFSRLFGF